MIILNYYSSLWQKYNIIINQNDIILLYSKMQKIFLFKIHIITLIYIYGLCNKNKLHIYIFFNFIYICIIIISI